MTFYQGVVPCYTLFAARDLQVGDSFDCDGHAYQVVRLHTGSLEGYDRFNRVALQALDLASPTGATYLFCWDANLLVQIHPARKVA